MINGKGTGKNSSEFASSDPVDEYFPWQGLDGGDASPVSSRYSSCGESEFDRYCSANSVMGTPSLCGSVGTFQDTLDSDFGSLKSFRLGDDTALDNLSCKSRYDRKIEDSKVSSLGGSVCVQRFESRDTKNELEHRNNVIGEGSAGTENELSLYDEFIQQKANAEATEEDIFDSPSGVEFDGGEGGRCSDDGETSSRFEHSEGEDSMFGCGTDDEKQIDYYQRRNIQYSGESNNKNETSLGMNSSIAFGSDDWDDFMQEHKENSVVSIAAGELHVHKQKSVECEDRLSSPISSATMSRSSGVAKEELKGNSLANKLVQDEDELAVYNSSRNRTNLMKFGETEQVETVKNMLVMTNRVETGSVSSTFDTGKNSVTELSPLKEKFKIGDSGMMKEHGYTSIEEVSRIDDCRVSKSIELEKTKLQLDLCSASTEAAEDRNIEFRKDSESHSLKSLADNDITRKLNSPGSSNLFKEEQPPPVKTEDLEINGFHDEIVHEMEEILLDSGESPGTRFSSGSRTFQFQTPPPLRDGGSTASTSSTSGTDDTYQQIQRPMRIDRVEVVGARQKKGDVSFSERLVGVKEYTVYQIRVWSGKDHWEVERRYRDFSTLYRRLKTLFANHGWVLPSPWSSVERESRKIFGNSSPDVIAERSVLIQECLRSILDPGYSSNFPGPLIWFLSPPKGESSSSASDINLPQSPFSTRSTDTEKFSPLGKTISLVVKIQPYKSTKQMLESQHYTCAGCHKHFDDGKTRMLELVQTLGWGKPRLCAYSGQLFCSSCHTNDTAVLPARVLHLWDFTQYPISQLAKSYLDSIHDQPMLCVSAINPFLFSKVPALQHVTNVRKRIGAMLPYVRCPFRRTIHKGLGSRRYLLESADFFALRDLIDLSKGVFAALPVMVETVSRKILEHITEQCLICYDAGVPCNARQACEDPSALIFPFQEGEVERCRSCESVFHKPCFKRMASCPCGMRLKGGVVDGEVDGTLDLFRRKEDSSSTLGLLSGLFSKVRPEKLKGSKDSDTVILMGSLPNPSL